MLIEAAGISLDLPTGWEGAIRPGRPLPSGAIQYSLTHAANFPLPPVRGDYGSGAVDGMVNGDVFIAMLEFDPDSAGTALFAASRPAFLRASDFSRDMLQQRMEGQGGSQRFFTDSGRAFCLYVVVGDYIDRTEVLPGINRVLSGMSIR